MTERPATPRKRPSIYDVAELAGVSHMTVSRVLNDAPNIAPATRERVRAAIDAVHYRPSSAARALARQRTMRIGVVVNAPDQYGPNTTLLSIEKAARKRGYTVAAHSSIRSGDEAFEAAVVELDEQDIDALIVIGPQATTPSILLAVSARVPVVVIGAGGGTTLFHVDVDQGEGARLAIEHLVALGHRSIIHLAGPLDGAVGLARERAARRAVDGKTATLTSFSGDWSSEFGFRVGADAALMGDASAVFASNDQMALGVIHGLATRGIRVPTDVSVIGFDDMPGAAHFLPPLTTVRQDLQQLGDVVLETIGAAIAGTKAQSTVIPPTLVIRDSTAAPPLGRPNAR